MNLGLLLFTGNASRIEQFSLESSGCLVSQFLLCIISDCLGKFDLLSLDADNRSCLLTQLIKAVDLYLLILFLSRVGLLYQSRQNQMNDSVGVLCVLYLFIFLQTIHNEFFFSHYVIQSECKQLENQRTKKNYGWGYFWQQRK